MKNSTIYFIASMLTSCITAGADTGKPDDKTAIYNIVILDQSGSMDSIKREAMSGYNETVQTIKAAHKKHATSQQHYVTLVLFNSSETRVVYNNLSSSDAKELTAQSYQPNAGTPLYDAMGTTLSKIRYSLNEKQKHKVLVTIITDGEENASKEYSGAAIKKLVDELKGRGWVFTYIGANQDVERVAATLSVDRGNVIPFQPSAAGTKAMFKRKNASRSKWFDRVAEGESAQELQQDFFEEDDSKKE